jgi:hypothetical protein
VSLKAVGKGKIVGNWQLAKKKKETEKRRNDETKMKEELKKRLTLATNTR